MDHCEKTVVAYLVDVRRDQRTLKNLVSEQGADGLGVRDTQDGLAQKRCTGQLANLAALAGLGGQRNGVRDNQLVQLGMRNTFNGLAREHRVGTVGVNRLGTALFQSFSRLAQRAGRIHHVVHQNAGASVDVTNDVHDFGYVGTWATLVDNGQIHFQLLGQCTCSHHTADVRRDNHHVLVVTAPDITQQNGGSVDIVDRDIEETLDLVSVQI